MSEVIGAAPRGVYVTRYTGSESAAVLFRGRTDRTRYQIQDSNGVFITLDIEQAYGLAHILRSEGLPDE